MGRYYVYSSNPMDRCPLNERPLTLDAAQKLIRRCERTQRVIWSYWMTVAR